MKKKTALIALLSLFAMIQISGEQRSHEHGVAQANLIMEGTTLELIIRMPGADFIGFEHAAENEREKTMIRERIESLEEMGDQLISFRTRRRMKVVLDHAHVSLIDGHGHDEHGHDEHGHDEHGHDEHGHDEHGHDEHGHDEHGHDEHGHEAHNEYEIRLIFEVQNFERIRHIDFESFFQEFPSLERIQWVSISPNGQNAGAVTASDNRLKPNP